MTEQCYYIGIDMDDRNAVISYYKAGMREPETLSTIAGSEIYQIPVALIKKRGIGQWFIGEEAKKMALLQNEDVIGHLLDNALAKKQVTVENIVYEAEELFVLYIKKLLLLASRLGNPGLPDCLVITVEALSRELTELFGKVAEDLGLGRSQLILQDRKESFYYFVYNQKQELWLHDIFLFDCRGDEVRCCATVRDTRTVPQMVTITEEVHALDGTHKDESFYKILLDSFHGHICSSVYLVGDGFDGDWMKMSLSYMCKGRRAFIGKNLYSKGACYAAIVREQKNPWPYVYMGDNEMKVNVSLKVKNRGKWEFLSLINAGDNWYEASGDCEVLLDGDKEIDFWLQLPHSRDARIEKLELSDLPERKPKTTRLRISAKPVSDSKVKIKIRDLGFGEIVKSSDLTWEYTMSLLRRSGKMGELILCSHPIAAMPYYIDNISLNVYSLEELCYYMENHLYLIEADFMSEELCLWIGQELGDKELAQSMRSVLLGNGNLSDFTELILRSCGYCSEDTIRHIRSVLLDMQNKSVFECSKIRADRYMESEKYVKAIHEYRKLLGMEEECKKNPVLEGNIRHNLGTACARLFLFDEAATNFLNAYRLNQNRESLTACMAACRLAKKTDILKKYKEEFHVSDEAFKSMSDQWNAVLKSEDILEKQREAEHLIKDAQGQLEENKPLMEQIRKWSEAYKKSCRL